MEFEKRRVGRTKLKVTTMGLGTASLAGNVAPVTEEEGRMLVAKAYEKGIRYFDAAPFYGYGKSEHVLGDGLREQKDWVLSTKVGRLLRPRRTPLSAAELRRGPFPFAPFPFAPQFDYGYDATMRAYEDSMQRLGLNHIDIVYIHDIDVYSHGSKEAQEKVFRTAMDETYKALDKLRTAGDIKAIGLGVNEAQPIADAMQRGQFDVFLLAGRYTLLEQAPLHSLFPEVKKHGASIVIGGPFNSGVLVGGKTFNYAKAPPQVVKQVKRLQKICDAHDVPLAAAALQFTPAHPIVASVIPGPQTAAELKQILAWWKLKIPAALWRDLKSEGVLDKDAPVPK
ncbi:MAG TPA: aldo/keto reductase [Bauldia sp.]